MKRVWVETNGAFQPADDELSLDDYALLHSLVQERVYYLERGPASAELDTHRRMLDKIKLMQNRVLQARPMPEGTERAEVPAPTHVVPAVLIVKRR